MVAEKNEYLFIGNTWYPNWHATVDGNNTSIFKANYTNMAVVVPQGKHIVELHYDY